MFGDVSLCHNHFTSYRKKTYLPDLGFSNYLLFPNLKKKWCDDKRFVNNEEEESAPEGFLKTVITIRMVSKLLSTAGKSVSSYKESTFFVKIGWSSFLTINTDICA